MERKAIVIGGSLGGLLTANLLHRGGWDVRVYEQVADPLEGRGAGIVTQPPLLEAMRLAGAEVDDSIGVPVQERVTLARDGSVEARRALPQILTSWSRLYQLLKDAFPAERYHQSTRLASLEQDAASVAVRFSGGQQARADLVVAADGIRSTVRAAFLPQAKPVYAGYLVWRGMVDETALSERVRKEVFPYFSFGLPPREQFVAYPVAGRNNTVEPGKRRLNFDWYRPADESVALRDMLTDRTGKVWLEGIPPPLIRADVRAQARRAANEVLAPQFAELVEKTENLFFLPIFDVESSHIAFGRVALVGDAAFVARPHCGAGVAKAAEDARQLMEALETCPDITAALKHYSQERVAFGKSIVSHARALGAYMQAQLGSAEARALAEICRTAETVMRDTAVAAAH